MNSFEEFKYISIRIDPSLIVVENCKHPSKSLLVDWEKSTVKFVPWEIADQLPKMKARKYFQLFGFVFIRQMSFLVLVNKIHPPIKFIDSLLFQIQELKFLKVEIGKTLSSEAKETLQRMHSYLSQHLYYSWDYNLTLQLSQQDQRDRVWNQFAWNRPGLAKMIGFQDEDFFSPVIQGFVKQAQMGEASVFVVSRWSYF